MLECVLAHGRFPWNGGYPNCIAVDYPEAENCIDAPQRHILITQILSSDILIPSDYYT